MLRKNFPHRRAQRRARGSLRTCLPPWVILGRAWAAFCSSPETERAVALAKWAAARPAQALERRRNLSSREKRLSSREKRAQGGFAPDRRTK